MKSSEVRAKFLNYFTSKDHQLVKSSSLVPINDNTLLFTNSGMNQFKEVFLGFANKDYLRATSAQKCLRAGGKHNDLENVGYTERHHTFFEMLGNFSFGDYFKEEAIKYAWEFLTDEKWLSIPANKLLVTVYAQDQESYDIWKNEIGLSENKIIRIGDNKGSKFSSDNFWKMGNVGPCGPCSEIFYDHGEHIFGGIPGSANEDGDRFIEIWNCVFMQYNIDENGNMSLLPKPCIDTGMGLERISAVMQHVHSNYHIDLFQELISSVAKHTNTKFDLDNYSLRVIADHIRACAFLIADGILPSNEGRNYVLRRIIRRAVRHGFKLGQKQAFFYKISTDLAKIMSDAYPELQQNLNLIKDVLYNEEIKFYQTLIIGMGFINKILSTNPGVLDGKIAFKLYDTYGFPLDLTIDICRERNILVDEHEFNQQMEIQRQRSASSSRFKTSIQLEYNGMNSKFIGYNQLTSDSKVVSLFKDNKPQKELQAGQDGIIVLDVTPFYAQGGGQVGDIGNIYNANNIFEVCDTQKIKSNVFGHYGVVSSGLIRLHDKVITQVNINYRQAIMRNHSVTHLLHTALIKVLGDNVKQKGSLVTTHKTRFDFSYNKPVAFDAIIQIENLVNQAILSNYVVSEEIKPYQDAVDNGAIALFDEKYEDQVRVISMGGYSIELCAGTHVNKTGDIGLFKIISESGVASGIRRIEGITGINSINWIHSQEKLLKQIMLTTKVSNKDKIIGSIENLVENNKNLEKEIINLKTQIIKYKINDLIQEVQTIVGINCLFKVIDIDFKLKLSELVSNLISSKDNLVVLLAYVLDTKVSICCGVSKNIINKIKASDLIKYAISLIGGKGGGSANLAQGTGNNIQNLPNLIKNLLNWVISHI